MPMLCLALLAGVCGAEPQCPITPESCLTRMKGNFRSAQEALSLASSPKASSLSEEELQQLCSLSNWMAADSCSTHCPLRLIVTEPESLRMTACLSDNSFLPYVPGAHIDQLHPLHDKVLDILPPLDKSGAVQSGCSEGAFEKGGYEGAIVALPHVGGSCSIDNRARAARHSNATLAIEISSDSNARERYHHRGWFSGSSAELESFPVLRMTPHYGAILLEELALGTRIRGKVNLMCEGTPETHNVADYVGDRCPTAHLEGVCSFAEDPKDRICDRCPLEMTFGKNFTGCLWGNDLLPRMSRNLLQNILPLPGSGEIVVAEEMPYKGCNASDYEGLGGKIVVVEMTSSCVPYEQVRHSQKHDVRAMILISSSSRSTVAVEGPSMFATNPVHSLSKDEGKALQALAKEHGAANSVGFVLSVRFSKGLPLGTPEPTPVPVLTPTPEEEEQYESWEWSVTIVVCAVVIAVESVILVAVVLRLHRNNVEVNPDRAGSGFTVPLGVASMAVSLTLLVVVAVVAFTLAHSAGQDSTDTALTDGKLAAQSMYEASVKNSEALSFSVMRTHSERVAKGLSETLARLERIALAGRTFYWNFDGSWASFYQGYLQHSIYHQSISTERIRVFTTNGFFSNGWMRTDERESGRDDDLNVSVAVTNSGWGYGVAGYYYDLSWRQEFMLFSYSRKEHNASNFLGGRLGDPVAFAKGEENSIKWMVSKQNWFQFDSSSLPLSGFVPLINSAGTYMGAVEVNLELLWLGRVMAEDASGAHPVNMSTVLFDATNGTVIAATRNGQHWNDKLISQEFVTINITSGPVNALALHTVHDTTHVHIRSLGQYMTRTDGWSGAVGTFEQAAEADLQNQNLLYAQIDVSGGRAADVSGEGFLVEMRGGQCGDCIAHDAELNRNVLAFDGGNTLFIHRNLTWDAPFVSRTRLSSPGEPWVSDAPEFNATLPLDNSKECIAFDSGDKVECLYRVPLATVFFRWGFTLSMRVKPEELSAEEFPNPTTPQLFSDAVVGEANVRLFANGRLFMNVLTHGCITEPVPGGLPVGVWTTVAVRVDQQSGMDTCSVFLDGKLHSTARISDTGKRVTAISPYSVGKHFKGRMSNLMMFRHVLSDAEIASMHTTGTLVRDQPKKYWLVATQPLEADIAAGLSWVLGVMLPRDDVMRQADATHAEILEDMTRQESNTRQKLHQQTMETVLIIICIALFSVGVFLVFNSMLTRPFAKYAVLMTEAAVLHIDEMPENESFIRELRAMNSAMRVMLINLKEYRSYMPQSLQLGQDATEGEASETVPLCQASSEKGSAVSESSVCSDRDSIQGGAVVCRKDAMSLTKRKFTVTSVNICNWLQECAKESAVVIISRHGAALHAVLGAFLTMKGISEVFSGDRFVCTFNAAKINANHRGSGCTAALMIADKLGCEHSLKISASVTTGEGRVGNMGNALMKRFTFMSPVMPWSCALERFARDREVSIVADQYAYASVQDTICVKVLTDISYAKRSAVPIRVAEVVRLQSARNPEWMYHGEPAHTDEFKAWNDWVNAVLTGDAQGIKSLRAGAAQVDSSSSFFHRLDSVEEGVPYEPDHMRYH